MKSLLFGMLLSLCFVAREAAKCFKEQKHSIEVQSCWGRWSHLSESTLEAVSLSCAQRTWFGDVHRQRCDSLLRPGCPCCCRSVTKSYLTLCDPMDCSTPGFPVLHYLPEFVQIHVHWVGDATQPSHPLLPASPFAFNFSQYQGLLQWVGSSY